MKNTLAENMLRFGTKLTESDKRKVSRLAEQESKLIVTNVDLITRLKGKSIAVVDSPDANLIAFPSTGTPKAGDPVIKNGEGAVYQTGAGSKSSSYVLLGNIGKLTVKDGIPGIADAGLKVFTYFKSDAINITNLANKYDIMRSGNPIVPTAPYGTPTTATDTALIIYTLTKAKHGKQSNFGLLKSAPQAYITNLVKLFQTMNQLSDVSIDSDRMAPDSIMTYTKNVVAKFAKFG